MREQFKPKQVSPTEIQMWESLVSSQYYLKISTLGKEWRLRFLLEEPSLSERAVTVAIRLGEYLGTIRGTLLDGRWLQEILHGVGIETLAEPFRSAVIAVLLQDFFEGLSETSQLPLQLINDTQPALGDSSVLTLHWQMVNDYDEPEIIGSLSAEEGLIVQVQAVAATWPVIPRKIPESLRVFVDVLIGMICLSWREYNYLEVGDILLIGAVKQWRQEDFLLRVFQGKKSGSLIPINSAHFNSDGMLSLMKNSVKKHSKSKSNEDENSVGEESLGSEIPNYQTSHKETANPATTNESEDHWLDAIEVTLEFSLGRKDISIGELRRIGQGHYFPIQASADTLVNILLQGKSIGRGELIQVGEELGILVRELELEQISPSASPAEAEEAEVVATEKQHVTRE